MLATASAGVFWFVVVPARVARAIDAARAERRGPRELTVVREPARRLDAPAPAGVQVFTATGEARDGVAAFGKLWVATPGGVLVFDQAGGAAERTLTWLDGLGSADATAVIRWGRDVVVGGGDGSVTLIDGETVRALRFGVGSRTAAVAALADDGERLLIATLGAGLIAWDGTRATTVSAADGTALPAEITAIAVASDGKVAVGGGDGRVFVARSGLYAAFGLPEAAAHGRVTALAWSQDALLVGRPFGLDRIEADGQVRAIATDVFVTALLVDGAGGHTWMGSFDAGVRALEGGGAATGPAGRIAALRLVDGRPVAFGAAGALDVAAGGRPRVAWPAAPLPGPHVTALAARGDEVWAGTFDHGLARFGADGRVRGGFAAGEAYGLAQINDAEARAERGDLIVATARGALLIDARGGTRRVLPRDGLAGDQIADTATRAGRVAYATNRGVTVVDDASGAARTLNATFGLANHHTTAVAWDAQERLWVGTLGGLSIVTPAFVVERNVGAGPAALGAAWITALVPAPGSPGMYVGTYGGGVAQVWPDGKVDRLDGPWARRPVRVNPGALIVHDGHVLAGTLDDGLLVYDPGTRRWSNARVPLGSRNVTSILWTADALWIGTALGLVRVARAAEVLS